MKPTKYLITIKGNKHFSVTFVFTTEDRGSIRLDNFRPSILGALASLAKEPLHIASIEVLL